MTARDILQELVRIRPDFEACWNDGNLFLDDDGSFTACGVFSQFTDFFCVRHREMKKEELEAIAALVGRCERDAFLTDSAYTSLHHQVVNAEYLTTDITDRHGSITERRVAEAGPGKTPGLGERGGMGRKGGVSRTPPSQGSGRGRRRPIQPRAERTAHPKGVTGSVGRRTAMVGFFEPLIFADFRKRRQGSRAGLA